MVVQKAVDNLKGKPQEDRVVVAGSIASLVAAMLFVGWVIYFFNKINSGSQEVNLDGVANQINLPNVREANQNIQTQFGYDTASEYERIRDAAAAQQAGGSQQQTMQVEMTGGSDQFNQGWGQ